MRSREQFYYIKLQCCEMILGLARKPGRQAASCKLAVAGLNQAITSFVMRRRHYYC